jgi:hypothetical protein
MNETDDLNFFIGGNGAFNYTLDANFTGNSTGNYSDNPYEVFTCLDPDVDVNFFEFITNGILLNVVGILGILGNILSMIILSRPQMRSSINYLLIGLARCDTALILTSMLLFGIPGTKI